LASYVTNAPIRNFIPSSEWLEIRWDNIDPKHANRGKSQPVQSEFERREIENNSESGIKARHRRGFSIAFASLMARNALEEFFERSE